MTDTLDPHLLPDSVQHMIDLIGLPKTLKLLEEFGGTRFPFSKNKTALGQIRYNLLAAVVGVPAADELTRVFGGDVLSIPRCATALRTLRNQQIRDAYDQQLRAGISSTRIAAELARHYTLTDRHVWRILGRIEPPPDTLSLF